MSFQAFKLGALEVWSDLKPEGLMRYHAVCIILYIAAMLLGFSPQVFWSFFALSCFFFVAAMIQSLIKRGKEILENEEK